MRRNKGLPVVVTTLAEVADAFGMSCSAVAAWRKSGMPGSAGNWHLGKVAKWLRGPDGPWSAHVDDELMSDEGGDSPGLERYRMARAKITELELETLIGNLMSTAKAYDLLGRWAARLRVAGAVLQRDHGAAAAHVLTESLNECDAIKEDFLAGKGREIE